MSESISNHRLQMLSTMPAGAQARRLAQWIAGLSLLLFALAAPFAKVRLPVLAAFTPIYQSALMMTDLITAAILFGQFNILRSRAICVLASAYLFTALMTAAHTLSFPGLFSASGWLGAGPQTTAWLYAFWHSGFPLFVIAYACMENGSASDTVSAKHVTASILIAIGSVLLAVALVVTITTAGKDWLVPIIVNGHNGVAGTNILSFTWMCCLAALGVLWWKKRLRQLLDLWLSVVLLAWLLDIGLAAVLINGRFDFGWYAGRCYGLLAASFLLIMLLLENNKLYTQLVIAHANEKIKNTDLARLNRSHEEHAQQLAVTLDALHHKEEEIQAVVQNILDCVITVDADGIVRSANLAATRIFGYARDELIGRNMRDLLAPAYRQTLLAHLKNAAQLAPPRLTEIRREIEGLHQLGHIIPLELAISEFVVHGQSQFICTLHDISERKRFIADLTQARADAEQGSRAKSAFLATMSHEIRTPMNGVVGLVELLGQTSLSVHQADLVKSIRESAFTLLGIIDDILDFSKIEAGRMEIEHAPLSVSDLVEGLCSSLVPIASTRGVDLFLFISPDVPERILSDDIRLRQMLYNLIGNAIKFSSGRPEYRGRVSVRVEIAMQEPLRLAFRITDNGIGMNAETVSNLFTPFTQAEVSTTRRFGGTGLGLVICKRLMEMMGGEITVSSAPGVGSSFSIVLPLSVAQDQPQRHLPDLHGVTCIIIDSPLFNSDDLRVYLERAGAHVHMVPDIEVAIARAKPSANPVLLHFVSNTHLDIDALKAKFSALPHLHHVLISRGRRRRPRVIDNEAIIVDGEALRRQVLLNAVAVAAGLDTPAIFQESSDSVNLSMRTQPVSIATARSQGRLILVAEDDKINQKVILQQLELLGYAAEIANHGKEALQMWRNGRYGLLLTDLHMPEMDGYTLTAAIRQEEPSWQRMPVLALTANALRGEANRAKAVGMDEYLTKPIQLRLLKNALDKWLPNPNFPEPEIPREMDLLPAENLDIRILQSLVGDDDMIVRDFLNDYLTSMRRSCQQLRVASSEDDVQMIASIAHMLKSSSRSVGALALGDLCAGLENLAKTGNIEVIRQTMGNFEQTASGVETKIRELLSKSKQ